MKRDMNWPLVGFFIVAATLPLAAFTYEFIFDSCTSAVLIEIAKEKPNFGCFEFFLNRYQTMIAAIAAVIAAGFTIAVTRQQTRVTALTNENVARVYAYDALKSFVDRAFTEICDIDKFEAKAPRGFRAAEVPALELANDKTAIAHLPPRLAREMFRLERKTKGINDNSRQLREAKAPIVQIYQRCALAVALIDAENLAAEIATPLGIFMPSFNEDIFGDIRKDAAQIPSLDTSEAVFAWLVRDNERRRQGS